MMYNPLRRPNIELPPEFAITAEDLTVTVDETTMALKGINLTIEPGEFVGIIGPNGSGKSTFENVILGLGGGVLKVDGTVKYGDLDIYRKPMGERERTKLRARHFGYVPKVAELEPTLTVKQNILRPYNLLNKEITPAMLHETAERFEVVDKLNTQVRALSSGYKQRVNVVRGLVGNPAITVLDEPTDALDPAYKGVLINQLRDQARQTGKTVIIVSHEDTGADRLVHLSGGKVVADVRQNEGFAA